MPIYDEANPIDAVEAARKDATAGDDGAWEALDRSLRWHLLTYVQDRTGELGALRRALLEATDWARKEEASPWGERWQHLLELLRDAESLPSAAGDLALLMAPKGRAAELLAYLAEAEDPVRPSDAAEALGITPQHLSNLSRKLDDAGLIVKHRTDGRATWLYVAPRGLRIARSLPALFERPAAAARSRSAGAVKAEDPGGGGAPFLSMWHSEQIAADKR